jgi:hypothetical protein
MGERKKITADYVLDLYAEAKKTKGIKRTDLMRKIIYFSQHLNERLDLDKVNISLTRE